jgi:hypothetical protein
MGRQASFEGASRERCEVAEAAPRCAMNHRAKLALNPRRQAGAQPARPVTATIRRSTHRRLPQTPALRLSSVVFFRRHDLRESQLQKQPCGTKAHAFLRAGKNWKCFLLKTNGRQQPLRALFPEAALCDKPAN